MLIASRFMLLGLALFALMLIIGVAWADDPPKKMICNFSNLPRIGVANLQEAYSWQNL